MNRLETIAEWMTVIGKTVMALTLLVLILVFAGLLIWAVLAS